MRRRERVTASAPLRQKKTGGVRADVPAAVRDLLGGRAGDTLVFEEGCEAAVQRAAIPGPYVVVRLERRGAGPEHAPADFEAAPAAEAPRLEPLAVTVSKRLRGQG